MSRVLLSDPDSQHAREIASTLRTLSCQTTTCSDLPTALLLLETEYFEVVLVVASCKTGWELTVDAIRQAAWNLSDPPQVICLLRGPYRGPSERVYAARKGFKVVYEQ
jgi:hypothetical protein